MKRMLPLSIAAPALATTLATVLILSCGGGRPTAPSEYSGFSGIDALHRGRRQQLTAIRVTPNLDTLGTMRSQAFTATGQDAYGNPMAVTPRWSVTAGGGSITPAGVFTAGVVVGTFANTVTAASGSVIGRATVVVYGPRLGVSPAALVFTAQAGGANPPSQPVTIAIAGGGNVSWSATSKVGSPWLTFTPVSGSAPSSLTVSVNLGILAAGTYSDTILVAGTGTAAVSLPVALQVTAAPGVFQTPDIITNASFEPADAPNQWDGFTAWGSGTPSVASPRTIGLDAAQRYAGASSVKFYLPATAGSDLGGQFGRRFSGLDRIYGRFYFFFDTGINGTLKFNIFESAGFNEQFGGLYIFNGSPLGDLCWWFVDWSGSSGEFVIANLSTLRGAWHSIEYDYWRSGHPSGYPAVRLWLDGKQVTAGRLPTGFGGTAYWDTGGWLVAGKRSNGPSPYPTSAAQIATSYYAGVLNGTPVNSLASNLWIDRVALSSIGRVGP